MENRSKENRVLDLRCGWKGKGGGGYRREMAMAWKSGTGEPGEVTCNRERGKSASKTSLDLLQDHEELAQADKVVEQPSYVWGGGKRLNGQAINLILVTSRQDG